MSKQRISKTKTNNFVEKILNDQDEIIETKELINQLDEKKALVEDLLLHGCSPDLLDLSKKLIDKFRINAESPAFQDDKEMELFYSFYKKELIAKYITFLTMAANHLFDNERLKKASIKDLSTSMATVLDMLKSLMGKPDPKLVKHSGMVELKPVVTMEEADRRIEEAKAKLKAIDVTDIESEVDDPLKF